MAFYGEREQPETNLKSTSKLKFTWAHPASSLCPPSRELKSQPLDPPSMTQLRLLGLSGSLRRASKCTAVLHGLRDALAPKAVLNVFPLHGIPLYNEDDDGEHA